MKAHAVDGVHVAESEELCATACAVQVSTGSAECGLTEQSAVLDGHVLLGRPWFE